MKSLCVLVAAFKFCKTVSNSLCLCQLYENYLEGHYAILEGLESSFRKNRRFEQIYRDFEMQKVCYLPMTSFILKPLHRLQHYHLLLDREYFSFSLCFDCDITHYVKGNLLSQRGVSSTAWDCMKTTIELTIFHILQTLTLSNQSRERDGDISGNLLHLSDFNFSHVTNFVC